MQGGTPERRKRRISVQQTMHKSDPKLTLYLYCVVEMPVGLQQVLEIAIIPVLLTINSHSFISDK